jgi:hypothetical protein
MFLLRMTDGSTYGPADMLTLVMWAREGRVTPETLVAEEGTEDWNPATSHEELAAVLVPPEDRALAALEGSSSEAPPRPHGSPVRGIEYQGGATQTNGMAVASLVMGIIGIIVCPIIFGVLAIIFGFIARSQIEASRGRQSGAGMAVAGIVLGFVGIPLGCLVGVLMAAMG